jgi:hypothetical protein
MAYIELSAKKTPEQDYLVSVDIYAGKLISEIYLIMTREELKQVRGMMHNALIDLNKELEWED